ncbi:MULTISPECIES: DUF2018 family protein [Arcobacter]|jgi:hypothetical protein|uniref:DUF2018 domain-containing protein n=1 Tax=Arcobacter ellisii TaxID=913109 RepID=A0A347U5T7_9BACT|nr:DUF2018 family protein [Arcobacter ellisii]AXX94215.1 DUF2018 domain-containing protein [Arcobacter ellisii]MBD3830886.1 DUF2018 family protein [Arcobacter sp.]RXI32569.1 hypothetical protein CP962_02890 [Arcobacter ellisii]
MSIFSEWFTEDEDDIFMGSPKSKFFDVTREASKEVVEDEIDKIIEKLAVLEMIISEDKDENFDINEFIKEYTLENSQKVKAMKKGLYVEFTGEIICRLDS